ncbi:MAG: ECF transporter S component [Eubacteriales bacterium]|nr:ECF transporter S component [Eubacteriales bacterium]
MQKNNVYRLTLSALFLALALVLPFLTGQIPQLGSALLPMHLPVLLCGFICGWPWGLAVGFIAPLLRTLLFGMPPLMPTAIAMAFELAAYGAFSGLLYERLNKNTAQVYVSLIGAMLIGRVVWGLVSLVLYGLFLQKAFTAVIFVAGAFINAWPGILAQLVLVPLIVLALQRAKLLPRRTGGKTVSA